MKNKQNTAVNKMKWDFLRDKVLYFINFSRKPESNSSEGHPKTKADVLNSKTKKLHIELPDYSFR
jgi:hypothetical protein